MEHKKEYENLNRIAAGYEVYDFDTRMRHYMMRSLEPFLVGGRALELGCFLGEFTVLLADRFQDLTVVEAAQSFIEHTQKRVDGRVRFINGLFETFAVDGRFDSIFLLHVLEHLENPVAVLRRAGELLTRGGRIFLAVPNADAASRRLAVKMGILPSPTGLTEADVKHGHRRVYSRAALAQDARQAGLRIIQQGGIFFKPLANFQFDRVLEEKIVDDDYMEACYELGKEFPDLCASIYLVCEGA